MKSNWNSNNKESILPEQDSIKKTLLLTIGFGGAFGLIVTVFVFSMHGFPAPFLFYIAIIPLFCAFVAGLAGISSVFINRLLLKIGVLNLIKRQIIGVIIVIIIAMTIGLWSAAALGFFKFNNLPFVLTTSVIGFIFGVVILFVDRRLWKMRQQVLTLELENKYLADLAEKDQQLQEITKNLVITEERNRLARELHDSISQGLHGIIFTLHSLRKHIQTYDDRTKEIIDHLEITADTTLSELRAMIFELKPSLLEERGLIEALNLHCELFAKRLKVKCECNVDKVGLTPQQEMAVYRIVQEALANIQQHAGANQVLVKLFSEANRVVLHIVDNGKGFIVEEIKRGNGLDNMIARCRENAGTLKIESQPGHGTKIDAVFTI